LTVRRLKRPTVGQRRTRRDRNRSGFLTAHPEPPILNIPPRLFAALSLGAFRGGQKKAKKKLDG